MSGVKSTMADNFLFIYTKKIIPNRHWSLQISLKWIILLIMYTWFYFYQKAIHTIVCPYKYGRRSVADGLMLNLKIQIFFTTIYFLYCLTLRSLVGTLFHGPSGCVPLLCLHETFDSLFINSAPTLPPSINSCFCTWNRVNFHPSSQQTTKKFCKNITVCYFNGLIKLCVTG